jgi:murein DD-endopeptidase MepM/ murein hydrolase activator NlpD
MKKLLILALTLVPLVATAASQDARLSFTPLVPKQGDTLIISLTEKPISLTYNGTALTAFPYQNSYRALVPLAATTKAGIFTVSGTFADKKTEKLTSAVFPTAFTVINLPVPPKLNQTPAQLVTSLVAVNKNINAAVSTPTQKLYFSEPFGLPLADNRRIGSGFGEIRKTGPEEIRHLGTDFTAKTGTSVYAINAGVVSKSYLDTTYGNTVIIDHGYGINTLYMHLNERKVKEGELIIKGGLIGTVGETGYASGPHLHLSLKINGVSIDPLQFVRSFK